MKEQVVSGLGDKTNLIKVFLNMDRSNSLHSRNANSGQWTADSNSEQSTQPK